MGDTRILRADTDESDLIAALPEIQQIIIKNLEQKRAECKGMYMMCLNYDDQMKREPVSQTRYYQAQLDVWELALIIAKASQ